MLLPLTNVILNLINDVTTMTPCCSIVNDIGAQVEPNTTSVYKTSVLQIIILQSLIRDPWKENMSFLVINLLAGGAAKLIETMHNAVVLLYRGFNK